MRSKKTNKQKKTEQTWAPKKMNLDFTVENVCLDKENLVQKMTLEPRLECQEQLHLVFQAEGTARAKP